MKIKLFFIGVMTYTSTFAQKTEFIVTHTGDTVLGKVKLINKKFMITQAGGSTLLFNASDVKKVYSSDIKFNTVVPCKLYMYTDNLTELRKYEYIKRVIDTVLVLDEVYSTPKMNLYWGMDYLKQQYYFYKTPYDSLPIQLYINYSMGGGATGSFEKGLVGEESKVHLEIQKGYVNQLRLIMGDCKYISDEQWEVLDYRIYSLKSVIKKFNKCN